MLHDTRLRPTLGRYIVLGAALLSFACAKADNQPSSDANETFKVALLTPGPVSDQSWNGGAYQGLTQIRDTLGASISHIQTTTPAEFDENFRQYGAQGYALVIGHGFEYQDAAKRVAPEFPKTIYLTTSGSTSGANLAGISFGFSDASYVAGLLAGSMTKSHKIGVIGGQELPPVVESFKAFEQGAHAVDPSIKLVSSYIGNWDDVNAGKEQALAQIAQGVDVIFQNADAAGLGVFQAARDKKNVYVIGSNADQNGVAPDVTLGSVVINLPRAFLKVAREVKAGTFEPRVVVFGEADSVVTLVLNPTLADRIPAAARARIDSTQARMLAGTLSISASGDSIAGPR